MSDPISGMRTKLLRWDADLARWVEQNEVYNIAGPDKSRETIDVTSFNSIGGYMKKIAGLRNPGTIVASLNYTRETFDVFNNDFDDDAVQNYAIQLPDDEQTFFEFEGLVTKCPLTIPYNSKVSMEVTIEISGKIESGSGSIPDASV